MTFVDELVEEELVSGTAVVDELVEEELVVEVLPLGEL